MKNRLFSFTIISLLALLLVGCATQADEPMTGAYINGVTLMKKVPVKMPILLSPLRNLMMMWA
ncbi:MAG: hypothetical protein JEZ00_20470 [Anaerolineaceae bacterium]|nr:hypothetical protein [Anaerolineaceae bacterium]